MPRRGECFRYWAPVLLWMLLIFAGSTSLGAGSNTSRILGPLLNFFFPGVEPETIAGLRLVIRKLAHFTEYAVLSALLWRALARGRAGWQASIAGQAWLLAVLYAMSDEFHQSFVPGRVGTPVDVMIDAAGAAGGLALLWLWGRRGR